VFEKFYGHHNSKSSISQMMQTARADVLSWLSRPLESYYPIVSRPEISLLVLFIFIRFCVNLF
ncbi:MAG: transposase, partial [Cytophagales bacterium]